MSNAEVVLQAISLQQPSTVQSIPSTVPSTVPSTPSIVTRSATATAVQPKKTSADECRQAVQIIGRASMVKVNRDRKLLANLRADHNKLLGKYTKCFKAFEHKKVQIEELNSEHRHAVEMLSQQVAALSLAAKTNARTPDTATSSCERRRP